MQRPFAHIAKAVRKQHSTQDEDSFHQQTEIKFKEDTGEVPHSEHSILRC